VGLLLATVAVAVGCGGESGASEEQVARERKDAADQARQQERIRQLEREIKRDRNGRRSSGSGGGTKSRPSNTGGIPQQAAPSGKDCGGGVSANANTTCSFALNVRDEYRSSGGSSVIEVYSPVTKLSYTMSCGGSSVTTCTGGNNASVTIR